MLRLEIDRALTRLMRRVSRRPDHKDTDAAREDAHHSGATKDELFVRLRDIPDPADDARMLVVSRARVTDCGEDSFLAVQDGKRVFLGVFDGCGGSGGKTYAAFDGHTGAWAASRAATLAAQAWFLSGASGDGETEANLAARLRQSLQACNAEEPGGQLLLGSLSKAFPTTVASFVKAIDGDEVDFYWCGDSRCYVLDAEGLHQVTADDASIRDAMRNLREDAPMTNVASASQPFVIHEKRLKLKGPSLVFAATDGCFGYLPSPMAFERLLLQTLSHSMDMRQWRRRLSDRIGEVSGDDYTLAAWPHRFAGFKTMKRAFRGRLAFLERHFPPVESEEALFEQWNAYRKSYECMMIDGETDSERDD